MPPGTAQDFSDLHDMANGRNPTPTDPAEEKQGAGGAGIWVININSQKNGGQSAYGSATGAAYANGYAAAFDYAASALPCAVKQ